ncbi:AsmA-like C-terminal region [Poseidonocella pacifica]|uniref:AsmA-like C-terminal region n=1 Tax=Poseidonocella pacifica TaxID=871651 RepID=A0A1I0V9D3_9RHOB|nr:AsmA-like C-terminal region-containing protein [Poseidonocella pacifica]SFA72999.1 AsmA-like C-terminal region [Poseidonocella pacifica]
MTQPDAPTRGQRLRRHALRTCLTASGLGLICALVVGLTIYAHYGRAVAAPAWLQARVEARLAETLPGMQLDFDDMALELSTSWRPRVILTGVEISSPEVGRIARIEDLRATFARRAALRREMRPRDIALTGAVLTVRRDHDGDFELAFGDAASLGEGAVLDLMAAIEAAFDDPRLSYLRGVEARALTLRYEDAHAERAWTVDGGLMSITREGDTLDLSTTLTVLGQQGGAATLEGGFETQIGAGASEFQIRIADVPGSDLATQSRALGWLAGLQAPISGAIRGSVTNAGGLGPISASLRIGAGALQPNERTRPIPLRSARAYFTYAPESRLLNFDEFSLESDWVTGRAEGYAQIVEDEGGWPTAFAGQLEFTNITANPGGLYPEARGLDRALLDLRLTLDPFRIELGEGTLFSGDEVLHLSGAATAEPEGWSARAEAEIARLPRDRLFHYWPETFKPRARRWVGENLYAADLTNAVGNIVAEPGRLPEIYLSSGFEGGEARILRDIPPIKDVSGRIEILREALSVVVEKGTITAPEGGALSMADTVFHIPDTRWRYGPALTRISAEGPVTALLSLLDQPPLELMSKAGKPVDLFDGQIRVGGTVRFPRKSGTTFSELALNLDGVVTDLQSETVIPGHVLAAPEARVTLTNEGVSIAGKGTFDGVPFDGEWTRPVVSTGGQPIPSAVTAEVTLTPDALVGLGVTLPNGTFAGEASGYLTLDLPSGETPQFTFRSDLIGARLSVAPLNWSKAAGRAAELELSGRLGSLAVVDRLRLDAPGLLAEGRLSLRSEGGLDQLQLSTLRSGGWLDVSATLTGRGAGRTPAVAVSGGTVDLGKRPSSNASGPSGGSVPLSLALDRLRLTDTISLTQLRGDLTSNSGLSGQVQGRINGGARVSATLVPRSGRTAVRLRGEDAGDMLRDAGFLKNARNGAFDLQLVPRAAAGHYDGNLSIRTMRMQDMPVLAQLLDAISVVGILDQLRGPGIFFSEIDAQFRLTPQQLIVTQSSAVGPSIGVSLDGIYNINSKDVAMQGVLSPVYALNALGAPLTRKGEGLIGFTYEINGTSSDPRVSVNPLSALTPGFFREIFRRQPPQTGN